MGNVGPASLTVGHHYAITGSMCCTYWCWPSVGLMLDNRYSRWPNVTPSHGQCTMLRRELQEFQRGDDTGIAWRRAIIKEPDNRAISDTLTKIKHGTHTLRSDVAF